MAGLGDRRGGALDVARVVGLTATLFAVGCGTDDGVEPAGEASPLALGLQVAAQPRATAGATVQLGALPSGGAGGLELRWTQTDGATVTLEDAHSMHPRFVAPAVTETETLRFKVRVVDRAGATVERDVEVAVSPAPFEVLLGGSQRVSSGHTVSLNAQIDGQGAVASVAWRQTGGPPVVLDDPARLDPIFEAPEIIESAALTFELTVTRVDGSTRTRTTNVEVRPRWVDVWAGPGLRAAEGDTPILRASPLGALQPPLTWTWTAIEGDLQFDEPGAAETRVTLGPASGDGRWRARVRVEGQRGRHATYEQSIQEVSPSDIDVLAAYAPVQLTLPAGLSARLFAHASGGDGNYTYAWTDFGGTLSVTEDEGPTPLVWTTASDAALVDFMQVSVEDGAGSLATSQMSYDVVSFIQDIDAGSDRAVGPGQRVYLSGRIAGATVSDPYRWTKGAGPSVNLQASATDNPSLVAPFVTRPVSLTLRLRDSVADGVVDDVELQLAAPAAELTVEGPDAVVAGQRFSVNVLPELDPAPVEVSWTRIDDGPPVRLTATDALTLEGFVPPVADADRGGPVELVAVVRYASGEKKQAVHTFEVRTRPRVTFPDELPELAVDPEDREMIVCGAQTSCDVEMATVTCPADAPFGMNTVVMPGDGSYEVVRSCATAPSCRARWWGATRGDADCVELASAPDRLAQLAEAGTVRYCDYCCSGPACNAMLFPATDTLVTCDAAGCR